MNSYHALLDAISPVTQELAPEIRARLDALTKPRGSLGKLEEIALKYCLVRGTAHPEFTAKRICCFAGDHGVAAEGVSAFPPEVTSQMVRNMLGGGAAINVLARHVGAELVVVDLGMNDALDPAPGLRRMKVRHGTANIARGPAMRLAEARAAILNGAALAREAAAEGIALLGAGEMGIANTTPATALFAALLGCPVAAITGRGTGIDDGVVRNKVRVIEQALAVNREALGDPLATLAALGGLEIAGICGLVLGAAACRIPVVVDGFISTAGAVAARALHPAVGEVLFYSHRSRERGHRRVLEALGVDPILDLDLRLGEGTGAALAMTIVEAAIKLYNEMATFGTAGVHEA